MRRTAVGDEQSARRSPGPSSGAVSTIERGRTAVIGRDPGFCHRRLAWIAVAIVIGACAGTLQGLPLPTAESKTPRVVNAKPVLPCRHMGQTPTASHKEAESNEHREETAAPALAVEGAANRGTSYISGQVLLNDEPVSGAEVTVYPLPEYARDVMAASTFVTTAPCRQ